MTAEERQQIRERADKATPGWWRNDKLGRIMIDTSIVQVGTVPNDYDAEFIAYARHDVPALLAEIERLERRVQELEASRG